MCLNFIFAIIRPKKEIMLNIGIIGNTEVLEPYVKRIQKNKNANVIGKTSVGISAQINGFHFSIPEFNKVELIERADIFIFDNSSRSSFNILSEIIKKSKHIYLAEYINLTTDECAELIKLAEESGSVVQVANPYYYTPAIYWLNNNFSRPLFLDISKHTNNLNIRENLYPLLLMLIGATGVNPKKITATAFENSKDKSSFANVRLEFDDSSVVNINFGSRFFNEKFKIKGFSKDQFISLNFKKNIFSNNNLPIDLSDYSLANEFDTFINLIQNQAQKNSNMEDYYLTMKIVDSIEKKITQFIS